MIPEVGVIAAALVGAPVGWGTARLIRVERSRAMLAVAVPAAWVASVAAAPGPTAALLMIGLSWLLLCLAAIDIDRYRLPDPLVAAVAMLGIGAALFGWIGIAEAAFGALLFGAVALLVRALVSRRLGREAMGLGDVKLFAAAGVWLGAAALPPFLLAASLAGLAAACVQAATGRHPSDGEVPFGPAIALALWVGVVAQETGLADLRDPALLSRFLGLG